LKVGDVGCDSSVRLEFCGLFGLANDSAYLKSRFKS
jgi:hypothetical protein